MTAVRRAQSHSTTQALRLIDLGHSYGENVVFADTTVSLPSGRIYGVVGANGAGKSTLIKILAGLLRPSRGNVQVDGQTLALGNPRRARSAGISYIAQDLSVISAWTVEEQLIFELGAERVGYALDLAARLGVALRRRDRIGQLALEACQILEIVKGLSRRASVFLLDEPTSGLDAAQRDLLYGELRRLADLGSTCLVVSHDLNRLAAIADDFLVVEDGHIRMSAELPADYRSSPKSAARTPPPIKKETSLLSIATDGHQSLQVHAGELVGLSGSLRSGAQDLLRRLYGLGSPPVNLRGQTGSWRASAKRSRQEGIVYISRDRQTEWGFDDRPMWFNLAMASGRSGEQFWGFVSDRTDRVWSRRLMVESDIRPPQPDLDFGSFSGGNRQKAVITAALARNPVVLLLDEPLSGIDAAARRRLSDVLGAFAKTGGAALIYSQEVEELASLCDRVEMMA